MKQPTPSPATPSPATSSPATSNSATQAEPQLPAQPSTQPQAQPQAKPKTAYEVPVAEAGTRLDKWFYHHFPQLATQMVQRIIRKGEVRVNRKRVTSATRLATGDSIRVPPFSLAVAPLGSQRARQIASQIVVQRTAQYLLINKPPQMASQGGNKVKNHLDSILTTLGEGINRPRLVHRLDKATSGAMVVAANAIAASNLAAQFKAQQVRKCYWALVCGVPKQSSGVLTFEASNSKSVSSDASTAKTHKEQTAYQVVATSKVAALVALLPKSGKKHQLRRHCSQLLGTPIQGDDRYGKSHLKGINGKLHLHSVYLEFSDPATNRPVRFFAPPPAHFSHSVEFLGLAEASWWKKLLPPFIMKPEDKPKDKPQRKSERRQQEDKPQRNNPKGKPQGKKQRKNGK